MAGSKQNARRRETGALPFDVCADRTRWRLLRILQLQSGWITEGRLAAKLEAATADREEGTDANRRHRIRLRHTHLPKLADRNLLVWDEAEGRVRGTERTATVVDEFADLVELAGGEDGPPLDAFADERRRSVLALVETESGPVPRAQLAKAIATGDGPGSTQSSVRAVEIDLHHHHLPKLAAAEVVEYDADEGTVTYCGPPQLPAALPER